MARNDRVLKRKQHDNDAPDPDLLRHIESLNLKTVDEYVSWCAHHGFSRRLTKNWQERLREHSFATRAAAIARLAQKKSEIRHPEKTIERIFQGELREDEVTQAHLKALCRAYKSTKERPHTQQAFLDLLRHVGGCGKFFETHPAVAEYGRHDANCLLGGLLALAHHSSSWIRRPDDWRPQTHNSRRQFSSLARHLVAHWPVPAFMDSVWFKGNEDEATRQQEWFLHIGNGENIRTANLPLTFTKKMAHHFMQAPADFTVEAAFRWGQIHGLGGDARLVKAVIGTRLGPDFENDEFWSTVLQFFVANPMLELHLVGPIVDYIYNQKYVPQDVFVDPGTIEDRPPRQPEFSMKGRTPASLMRMVGLWHRTLQKTQQPLADWSPSGIEGFEFVEGLERGGSLKVWKITELLNTKALAIEGRIMRHCVASYARSCARGDSSIWTMEVESSEGKSKLMTIEVQNSMKLICQVRGKCNALPAEKHRNILRRWAEAANLRLSRYAE